MKLGIHGTQETCKSKNALVDVPKEHVLTLGASSSKSIEFPHDYIPSIKMDAPYVNMAKIKDPRVPTRKAYEGVIVEEEKYK